MIRIHRLSRNASAYALSIVGWVVGISGVTDAQSSAQTPAVRTHHNDVARTGVNNAETSLTRDTVKTTAAAHRFGKLQTLPVRGQVYAQPLYLPGVQVGATQHDLVFVATMRNNVYAYDANNYAKVWARNFGCEVPYNATQLYWDLFGYNIHEAVGILGTPVIDDAGKYLYFVTKIDRHATPQNSDPDTSNCTSSANLDIRFELHKVDVATGMDATAPQPIDVSLSPTAVLTPAIHLQRAALLFANGSIYVAFSGYQDTPRWHGWVVRFDAGDLSITTTFCVTPNGSGGGIWQAGSGLAADSGGNIYFMSGNGTTKPSKANYGTVFAELSASLGVQHYYAPGNHFWLNLFDLDLGSSGPVLLPNGDVIGGGKQGRLYALGRPTSSSPSPFTLRDDVQVTKRFLLPFFPPFSASHIHGVPVVWNVQSNEAWIFVWGERDKLKRYSYTYTATTGEFKNKKVSPVAAPAMGMPGGSMSLTVNGNQSDTAVLWASLPLKDAFVHDVPGILRAIDPDTLVELWSNTSESYLYAKYCPPTVAGGKVFLATFSNRVDVYGVLP
jgi:hypothetical protein